MQAYSRRRPSGRARHVDDDAVGVDEREALPGVDRLRHAQDPRRHALGRRGRDAEREGGEHGLAGDVSKRLESVHARHDEIVGERVADAHSNQPERGAYYKVKHERARSRWNLHGSEPGNTARLARSIAAASRS